MKAVNFLFFIIFLAIGEFIAVMLGAAVHPALGGVVGVLAFFLALLLAIAIKIAYQWERAVILRLGKYSSTKGPGLFFIIPVLDTAIFVDTRILTMDIPAQQVITKDNVPVSINGVVYFRVTKVEDAIIKVQNYRVAMIQYALTVLRDVIGEMTLDELLSQRERISEQIGRAVEARATAWGLDVDTIKLQDIDMPEELKKMMSRQASAEREKRATITKAEGDKEAALNLSAAAKTMAESPGAMQLRTLQTIDGLGPTASNTVIMAIPLDIMEAVQSISLLKKKELNKQ
ncbi:MAG TPA: membrane protease subunit, stomatin/prohibitin [Deltaproteobacteria bacterium]|nr:membrane protease subunit, stomatin/prohibitin [Deltaproteobacteria bacterium]